MKANELTVEEKLKLVIGKDHWSSNDLNGKLPSLRMVDGPIGRRYVIKEDKSGRETIMKSIAYPCAQSISHSWDPDEAYNIGKAIANDMIEVGADVLLGPGVNIKRTPRCGRNFEYYSEDPFLTAKIAVGYVKGVQDQHISACVKHFCANNIEFARHYCSSNLDERTLREIYLKQFETIIKEANPWTIMCSYNKVNGTWTAENKYLYDILKKEFGYKGVVVSDWHSVHNAVNTINSGLDIIMPFREVDNNALIEGHKKGLIDENALNSACDNMIALCEKIKAESPLRKITMSKASRRKLAYKAAQNGMVLLKNNNALPLTNERLVVTGAPIQRYYAGNGSSYVNPERTIPGLDELFDRAGFDYIYKETVRYAPHGQGMMSGTDITCFDELKTRDAVVIAVGDATETEYESGDRETIKLCRAEEELIRRMSGTGKKVIVVVVAGSAIDMTSWIDCADAVLFASYGGQYMNEAIVDVLTGKFNPCGHLTETFPISLEDVPAEQSYWDMENFDYDDGLMVGYRYNTTSNYPVLFPFGYGLSYSKFAYSDMKVNVLSDKISVSFKVTNTSNIDGFDVPQIYVGPLSNELDRPKQELKGFAKVYVKQNTSKKVTIDIPKDELKFFSINTNKWENTSGKITIMLGKNSRDIAIEKEMII